MDICFPDNMESQTQWIKPSRNQTGYPAKHIGSVKGSMFNASRKLRLCSIVVAIWNKVPAIMRSD